MTRYLACAVMILPALALVGAPFLSGGYAKLELKEQLASIAFLPTLISFSSIFTALLMYRFINLMYLNATRSTETHYDNKKYTPLIIICLLTSLLIVIWPFFLFEKLSMSFGHISASSWPIAVAISLGLLLNKYINNYVEKIHNTAPKKTALLSNSMTFFASLLKGLAETKGVIIKNQQSVNMNFIRIAINRIASINSASLSIVILMVLSLLFIAIIYR